MVAATVSPTTPHHLQLHVPFSLSHILPPIAPPWLWLQIVITALTHYVTAASFNPYNAAYQIHTLCSIHIMPAARLTMNVKITRGLIMQQ